MARITVEDCLEYERNRFSLVLLASRRAKALLSGRSPVTDTKDNKSVVSALREIADGKVRFHYQADSPSQLSIPSEIAKAPPIFDGEAGPDLPSNQAAEETETH